MAFFFVLFCLLALLLLLLLLLSLTLFMQRQTPAEGLTDLQE